MSVPTAIWRSRRPPSGVLSGPERHVRAAHTATLVGHLVYIWGGIKGGGRHPTTHVFIFDSVLEIWKSIAVHPGFAGGAYSVLFSHTATLVDDSILFIGGIAGVEERISSEVLVLDLLTQQLTKIRTFGKPCELAIDYHTANLLPESEEVIVFGGDIEEGANADFIAFPLFSFHAKTHKWRWLRWQGKFPPPRANHASCFVARKLYIFGGFTPELDVLSDLHILDFTSNPPTFSQPGLSWEPRARLGSALEYYKGMLFLFGGKQSARVHTMEIRTNDLLCFDLKEKAWKEVSHWTLQNGPTPRSNHRAVVLQNRLLIFGGTNVRLNHLLEITLE